MSPAVAGVVAAVDSLSLWTLVAILAGAMSLAVAARTRFAPADWSEDSEDAVLVRRAQRGDAGAFDRIIEKYQLRVYRFCVRILGDIGEAEELTQDVFVQIHANLKRFRAQSKFSTWLFQIAKNLSLNKRKYLQRRRHYATQSLDAPQAGDDSPPLEIADESRDALEEVEGRELSQEVRRSILELRRDQRTALVLRDIEGLSYDEIAAMLNIPEATVKSRIHRARQELRKKLEPYLGVAD